MGLLDQVIGNVVGQVLGRGRGDSLSPIARALLMLLISKGVGGILGAGTAGHARNDRGGASQSLDGDLGGFGGRTTGGNAPLTPDGDYSDLVGMLDGPSDRRGERASGAGPYARLNREPGEAGGSVGDGLGGLIESFERSELGDVIGSWIGGGHNQRIEPKRLAEALGPEAVETLSRQTSLERVDLLGQLAQALPSVVDALTPQGRGPHPDERRHW